MLLENKIKLCDNLTPVEALIASYIVENKETVQTQTILQLADSIAVSKSAVHRLCKKLGFNGFNELKVQLAENVAMLNKTTNVVDVNYPFEERDSQKMIAMKLLKLYETTIRDTYNYIDHLAMSKISRLLYNADVIDIYTHAHNLNPAENFQDKMLTIGRSVNCPRSFYEQRMRVLASDSSHVALIISYSGKATFIKTIIKKLHAKKIPIIFIGKAGSNLYPNCTTHYIAISDKENLRDRISQFSSHIALQYILDVLFGCIYNLNRQNNIAYLQEAINYMDDRTL